MSNFDIMEETVSKLCNSLIEKPQDWEFNSNTFKRLNDNIEYWDTALNGAITHLWKNSARVEIFSVEQGLRIREAVNIARKKQASIIQQMVINSFK